MRRAAVLSCCLTLLLLAACGGSSGDGDLAANGTTCTPAGGGASAPLSVLPGDESAADCVPAGTSGTAATGPDGSGSTPGGNQQTGTPSVQSTPTLAPEETDGDCPYISTEDAADLEGNRIGRTTVVSTNPPGCRFYFAYNLAHMTLQISTQTFGDPVDAYNAMVTASEAGQNAAATEGIGDGAVLYQTAFYPPDGNNDWACTFVKGTVLVTVNTDQVSPSTNARNIAAAIAPKF